MARAAARGDLRPTLITLAIGAILLVWAAYAFSGAGTLPRLPLLRTALIVITAIYLMRSEEHTSELQSLMRISYAVFCLKKKNKQNKHHIKTNILRITAQSTHNNTQIS